MVQTTPGKGFYQMSETDTKRQTITETASTMQKIEDEFLQVETGFLQVDENLAQVGETLLQVDQQIVDREVKSKNYVSAKNKIARPRRVNFFLYDSFTRTDSATVLGNAETNNLPYTILGPAVWGIKDNKAYVSAVNTAPGRSLAYQEANEADCVIEVNLSLHTGHFTSGIGFRITDLNNFWLVSVSPTHIALSKYEAGAMTTIKTVNRTLANGKLSVSMKGNKIEAYMDGFPMIEAYDSFNSTATKHGLYSRGESFFFQWDNLRVRPLVEIPLYVDEGFENGSLPWYFGTESAGLPHSISYSTAIKYEGIQSIRFELRKDDPDVANSKRSEIKLPSEKSLEEHWYGFRIYLPLGGDEDYANDTEAEIIVQWHTTPDLNEENVSPPLCIETLNGRYTLKSRWDPGKMTTQNNPRTYETYAQDLGSYEADKGRWVDWLFHVKWGWTAEQEPILEVYKDNELVCERNGYPNTMNDVMGNYMKLGLYKWPWHEVDNTSVITKRVMYVDKLFIR